jgi:hypothetical protein
MNKLFFVTLFAFFAFSIKHKKEVSHDFRMLNDSLTA